MLKTIRTCQDRKAATALVSGYTRRNNAKPWVLEARPCASVLCNWILKASSGWKSMKIGCLPAVASASPCHFRFFEQSVHEKHATPGTSRNTAWQHQHWITLKSYRKHLSYLVLQKFHEISTICFIFSSFVTGCNWPRFAFERFLMVFLTLISLGGTLLSSDYGTSGVVPVKSKAWPMPFKVLVQGLDSSTRRLDTKWSSSPQRSKSFLLAKGPAASFADLESTGTKFKTINHQDWLHQTNWPISLTPHPLSIILHTTERSTHHRHDTVLALNHNCRSPHESSKWSTNIVSNIHSWPPQPIHEGWLASDTVRVPYKSLNLTSFETTSMDILQPQADLQPLVGSQKCCLQPEMDSLSVLKVWVRQGEPRPSLPAGFPVKKSIGPLFHFLNHSQDENLGLLKHIIKVDPSINLLHCRIHLGQKSSKI